MHWWQTSNAKFLRFVRSSRLWHWRNRFGAQHRVRRRVVNYLQDGEAHTVPDLTQQLRLSSGRVQLALLDLERAGLVRQDESGTAVRWTAHQVSGSA